MATISREDTGIIIETDLLQAEVETEGYVSGVKAATLLDKKTGARSLGFGLDIVDFLLEPKWDDGSEEPAHEYRRDTMVHGEMPKRFVELPQICTGARKVEAATYRGDGFVAVKQWFAYTEATHGREAGSMWEQTLVFPDGQRYFLSADRITSVNTVDDLILRIDMPGHLKHQQGDSFSQIYLSYHGQIPAAEFLEDFAPDARFLYERDDDNVPDRMIRAYQVKTESGTEPWLAGMTLCPEIVSEAWCHQRGYVCFIQEIGKLDIRKGETFGAAYVVGFFDSVEEMEEAYDRHKGAGDISLCGPEGQAEWAFT